MFRSRKSSQTIINTSSLYYGNASIKPRSPPIELELEEEDDYDRIDTPQTQEELTIESISAAIAAAVHMSSPGSSRSSLSMGSASILQPFSKQEEKKRRFSFFSWRTLSTPPSLEPSYSSGSEDDASSEECTSSVSKFDDGRDELVYRGIQIKELKSTLKPFIISDEARFPMPDIKLERPSFAKINY